MPFRHYEISKDDGAPISLYLFKVGAGADEYYGYTDYTEQIVYQGRRYEPVPITRSSIRASGNVEDAELNIDITPAAQVVTWATQRTPYQQPVLEVRHGHVTDPNREFIVVWIGSVDGVTRPAEKAARITSRLITASLERVGVRREYQRICTWTLYEIGCGAARTIRSTPSPSEIGENAIRLGHAWNGAVAKQKFKGGYVSWRNVGEGGPQVRTILDVIEGQSTDVLLLGGDTYGLVIGTSVNLYAGCNHMTTDCKALHNNILNYGGQPSIPKTNPVSGVNRYY